MDINDNDRKKAVESLKLIRKQYNRYDITHAIDIAVAQLEENNTSTFELYEDEDFSGGGYLLCTQCKYKFSFGAYHILEYDNFCPHCGRKIIRQADPNTIELTFTKVEGGAEQCSNGFQ